MKHLIESVYPCPGVNKGVNIPPRGQSSYLGSQVHPRGPSSPQGAKFTPGGQVHPRGPSSPQGAKFTPGGQVQPRGPSSPLGLEFIYGVKLMLVKTGLCPQVFLLSVSPSSSLGKRKQQGCQIFLGTKFQNGGKCTRGPQTVPNGHKIFPMAIK
jgi:hypothetical protein